MKPKGSVIKRYTCQKPKPHEHGNKCPATWWARVIHVDPETGKVHDLSRRATSRADAIDKLTYSLPKSKPLRANL